jgi:hypothetical protein
MHVISGKLSGKRASERALDKSMRSRHWRMKAQVLIGLGLGACGSPQSRTRASGSAGAATRPRRGKQSRARPGSGIREAVRPRAKTRARVRGFAYVRVCGAAAAAARRHDSLGWWWWRRRGRPMAATAVAAPKDASLAARGVNLALGGGVVGCPGLPRVGRGGADWPRERVRVFAGAATSIEAPRASRSHRRERKLTGRIRVVLPLVVGYWRLISASRSS